MSAVENILASVDLMKILPMDCNLKSVGVEKWRGTCPIGNHAKGAFAVRRHAKGHLIYECFSCHERGSVIDMFAALNRIGLREAIFKLSGKVPQLSTEALMQRSLDSWNRAQPEFAWLICDTCGAMKKLDSREEFAILCKLGSWLWDVAKDGSARCVNCRRLN